MACGCGQNGSASKVRLDRPGGNQAWRLPVLNRAARLYACGTCPLYRRTGPVHTCGRIWIPILDRNRDEEASGCGCVIEAKSRLRYRPGLAAVRAWIRERWPRLSRWMGRRRRGPRKMPRLVLCPRGRWPAWEADRARISFLGRRIALGKRARRELARRRRLGLTPETCNLEPSTREG